MNFYCYQLDVRRYTCTQNHSMKPYLLTLLLFLSWASFAQNTRLEVTIDAKNLSDGLGRGMIYSLPDSSLVKGSYIDSSLFSVKFKAKIGDEFYLRFSIPDYIDTLVSFQVQDSVVRLDRIVMNKDLTLDEVTVVYQKPVFERTMNGIKVNVKGTTLEELNTLFDILKASPRLSSPDDENIEIIGRGSPLILIDRQPLMTVDELKAIPASEVDRFEIILNPSAKYRAQGSSSGVIEVYTNSFSLQGYRAQVRSSGGLNTEIMPTGNLNVGLNLKKGKFSLDGNYGTSYRMNNNYSNSGFSTTDYSAYANFYREGENTYRWQYYKLKMGYAFSDKQRLSFGVGGHGSIGSGSGVSDGNYYANDTLTTRRVNTNVSDWKWQNYRGFTNYTVETDTIGSALDISLNVTQRVSESEGQNLIDFYDKHGNYSTDYNVLSTSQNNPLVGELRANFEYYIDSQFIFETGLDVSALINDKKFNRYNYDSGSWVEDQLFTNSYDYQEATGGIFAQISKKWNKFGAQVGLRGEYTYLNGYSQTLDQQFMDSTYLLPFPNAGVMFEPNDNLSITAFYSSGIDRPSFSNYDPFIRVTDSLNVSVGNPYLRPSYEHTFGLEFDLFYSYNISLGYSIVNDFTGTVEFVDPETFISTSTPWNADYQESYSLSLSIPFNLPWLDGWNSLWMNYDRFYFTEEFMRDPFENISMGLSSYLTFKLPHDFRIVNSFYMNKWGDDSFTTNVGRHWSIRVTKEFKKPELNIYAFVDEILPNNYKNTSISGNSTSYFDSRTRFTSFNIGFLYKFGRLTAQTNIKESESKQSGRF